MLKSVRVTSAANDARAKKKAATRTAFSIHLGCRYCAQLAPSMAVSLASVTSSPST